MEEVEGVGAEEEDIDGRSAILVATVNKRLQRQGKVIFLKLRPFSALMAPRLVTERHSFGFRHCTGFVHVALLFFNRNTVA